MISSRPARLFLLRHARAGWAEPGESDHERALDERGIAEARALGDHLRKREFRFDVVVTSTAVRARQTVEELGAGLFSHRPLLSGDLYALGPEAYWAAATAREEEGNLLLVGHNPTIETFALSLTATVEDALAAGFPTCGLAIFEAPDGFKALRPGGARLIETVFP